MGAIDSMFKRAEKNLKWERRRILIISVLTKGIGLIFCIFMTIYAIIVATIPLWKKHIPVEIPAFISLAEILMKVTRLEMRMRRWEKYWDTYRESVDKLEQEWVVILQIEDEDFKLQQATSISHVIRHTTKRLVEDFRGEPPSDEPHEVTAWRSAKDAIEKEEIMDNAKEMLTGDRTMFRSASMVGRRLTMFGTSRSSMDQEDLALPQLKRSASVSSPRSMNKQRERFLRMGNSPLAKSSINNVQLDAKSISTSSSSSSSSSNDATFTNAGLGVPNINIHSYVDEMLPIPEETVIIMDDNALGIYGSLNDDNSFTEDNPINEALKRNQDSYV